MTEPSPRRRVVPMATMGVISGPAGPLRRGPGSRRSAPAVVGMIESQLLRMQLQPVGRRQRLACRVELIAENGVAECQHVDARNWCVRP